MGFGFDGAYDFELNNILFTPVQSPPMPLVDIPKLKLWLADTYQKRFDMTRMLVHFGRSALDVIGEQYPWDLTVAYWNLFGVMPGFINNFDTEFPELLQYLLDCWQFESINDLGGLVFLPTRATNLGVGFWHTDPEGFGLRNYISFERQDVNKLYLRKTNFFSNIKVDIGTPVDVDIMCQPDNFLCEVPLDSTRAFYINNINAVHTTFQDVQNTERICVIVSPRYKRNLHGEIAPKDGIWDRLKPLIMQSANTYSQYAIRY